MTKRTAIFGTTPLFSDHIPVTRPLLPELEEIRPALEGILKTGILSKGHHCVELEESIAIELEVKHVVAVSSCTTGLMLTYQALELSGDVVVPSFTFMSTVSALRWVGLRPVFADVDPHTTNVTPDTVRAALTPQTSAIVAVHNFGNPCDIDGLHKLAEEHGLRLIFDAAHAFGSRYRDQPVGKQGHVQVFSMSPSKLVVAGEGGIVATDSEELAAKIRIAREFGNCGDYDTEVHGVNGRLPEINALLAHHSFANLERAVENRQHVAALYRERLGRLPGIAFQEIKAEDRSSHKDFPIMIDSETFGLTRDELALTLKAENIDTRSYYDPPAHRQRAYRVFAPPGGLPHTEALSQNILCLPIWSAMSLDVVEKVCDAIGAAQRFAGSIHSLLNTTNSVEWILPTEPIETSVVEA
ncbi:MAG TPA: DegT/DnrJ/EryC1/StrS family aminotransferase [Pyrinomonadaceae bacterium]|nr:DegT/DnrJ/EryC1/StrS family aminotransferase [Pyrinomonadaceae bacterium]